MGGQESVIYDDGDYPDNEASMSEWDKLKREGHVCLLLLGSNPPQVSWCGKDKCEGNKR